MKTESNIRPASQLFENDVKMYGTQAMWYLFTSPFKFENDVKTYSM